MHHLLLVLAFCFSAHSVVSSSSTPGKDFVTPIPRWQESWTASQAHGTAMAMTVQDYLVIFLRSPTTDVYKPTHSTKDTTEIHGLRVDRIDRDNNQASTQYAPSWFPIGSHTVCAMTGLALDVEHVCRVLQKKADDHSFVYQKSMTTHAMTQKMATVLQNECLLKGSRPFGVQSLVVGCDDIDGSLCIYSIDPTGTWQSWGRGTAIGKFATDLRPVLAKNLQSSTITKLDEAIECLIGSWKETCKEMGINEKDKEDREVLILRKDPQNGLKSCLFRVPSDEIDRIIENMNPSQPRSSRS